MDKESRAKQVARLLWGRGPGGRSCCSHCARPASRGADHRHVDNLGRRERRVHLLGGQWREPERGAARCALHGCGYTCRACAPASACPFLSLSLTSSCAMNLGYTTSSTSLQGRGAGAWRRGGGVMRPAAGRAIHLVWRASRAVRYAHTFPHTRQVPPPLTATRGASRTRRCGRDRGAGAGLAVCRAVQTLTRCTAACPIPATSASFQQQKKPLTCSC